jgi:hypothetical protein
MDFADALHLAFSQPADVFYTFDTACRRQTGSTMPGLMVNAA